MKNRSMLAPLFGLIGALACSSPALAHVTQGSRLSVELADSGPVSLRWDLSLHDLIWFVYIDADYDGTASGSEIEQAQAAIRQSVVSQIEVSRGGQRCTCVAGALTPARSGDDEILSVALRAECPAAGRLTIGGALYLSGGPEQRVLITASRDGRAIGGEVLASGPAWSEPDALPWWRGFADFVRQGTWHVLIGYDHIAFLLLLLLPAVLRPVDGRWQPAAGLGPVARELVTVVTAFTVAHSTTLALAATGTVDLPAQPVEIAIAASIAVAGFINLMPSWARLRLALAFGFGLVHGFGFANVLREIDGGVGPLWPLLAGFNVGVELAQLAIVALVLPLIYPARTRRWYAGGVLPLGSCALGAAGLVWVVQRL